MVLFAPAGGGAPPFPQADKLVHAAVFALLAATARRRFGALPAVLVAVSAYAPLSEVAQGALLPGRTGSAYDALADLVGVGLGWVLAGRSLRG